VPPTRRARCRSATARTAGFSTSRACGPAGSRRMRRGRSSATATSTPAPGTGPLRAVRPRGRGEQRLGGRPAERPARRARVVLRQQPARDARCGGHLRRDAGEESRVVVDAVRSRSERQQHGSRDPSVAVMGRDDAVLRIDSARWRRLHRPLRDHPGEGQEERLARVRPARRQARSRRAAASPPGPRVVRQVS
jgi:hypothetical protein